MEDPKERPGPVLSVPERNPGTQIDRDRDVTKGRGCGTGVRAG